MKSTDIKDFVHIVQSNDKLNDDQLTVVFEFQGLRFQCGYVCDDENDADWLRKDVIKTLQSFANSYNIPSLPNAEPFVGPHTIVHAKDGNPFADKR